MVGHGDCGSVGHTESKPTGGLPWPVGSLIPAVNNLQDLMFNLLGQVNGGYVDRLG